VSVASPCCFDRIFYLGIKAKEITAAKLVAILGSSARGVEHMCESNMLMTHARGEVARWSLLEETLTNRTSLQCGEVEYTRLESVSRSLLLSLWLCVCACMGSSWRKVVIIAIGL
jgi:hypothetical protein